MIKEKQHTSFSQNERVNRILEVIIAYAGHDFSRKTDVLGTNDELDAISAGVNMLGEELQVSTVSLREKEYLLKEIHHRVKNNLQIVSSLLNLQSDRITDHVYLEMVRDSRNRINSMSLVHEMLYLSQDFSRIPIAEYVKCLCVNIRDSFVMPGKRINFIYTIEKTLFFDVDRMIPIGLILNEIICNSMKYAFVKSTGDITIEFARDTNGNHLLTVKDNGIGLPASFNPEKDANLGLQLVKMLVAQIDGTVEILGDNGVTFLINFK